jgi:ESF2/ABP1 family protein
VQGAESTGTFKNTIMSTYRNEYLDAGVSDSDHGEGYNSEAAEYSKDRIKRRKLSPSPPENVVEAAEPDNREAKNPRIVPSQTPSREKQESDFPELPAKEPVPSAKSLKAAVAGVVYLSSLPPYLKSSALRNLLTQRGFSPITRLFLAPSSKAKNHHSAKKSSRQLYTEGWIEFASKKIAKRCAETLNATTVGGRKGGFYHDDIWNMKYLRGVGWDDLMAQVREERREEEVRRTEERGQIARETKEFLEGVERGKMTHGIEVSREKKRKKAGSEDAKSVPEESSEKRRWRQYKVKGGGSGREKGDSAVSEDVKRVLSKIF